MGRKASPGSVQEWSPTNKNGEPVVTFKGPQRGGLLRTRVPNRSQGGGEERGVLDVDDNIEEGRSGVSETRMSQLRSVADWRQGGEMKTKV